MKISFKYGDSVICLPSKPLSDRLSEATREELCVLIALAADPGADMESICSSLNISNDEFTKAVSFWRGSGAITVSLSNGEKLPSLKKRIDKDRKEASDEKSHAGNSTQKKRGEKGQLPPQSGSIPPYSTEQIADFLEDDASLRAYIENCQQIMGKIFNTGEASSLIGIVQYLGVDTEYVALLCAFAVSHGKKSVRYVEKMAIGLYDEGITGYGELEEHLKLLNRAEEIKPEIRKMFGIGERALTSREKKYIESWCGEFGFDIPLIRKAYEITVTNTGKAAMPYANTILESWHNSGFRTAEEIDAAAAEYKKKKDSSEGSFDTNDFFEAALKRSYGS